MEDGSGPGGRAAGPQGDSPGVQHRPAGLRGRGRHAVGAQRRRREAAGAGGPHRRRHPLRRRGLAHRPGGANEVRRESDCTVVETPEPPEPPETPHSRTGEKKLMRSFRKVGV